MTEIIQLGPDCRERFLDQATFPELAVEGIWLGGLSQLRGLHHIDRAFEGRMMVSFALAGGSYYRVRGQLGHLQAGHALFVPPYTRFTLDLDEGGFRHSAWVILDRTSTWRMLEQLPSCFAWPDGPRFAQALEALHYEAGPRGSTELRRLLIAQCREYLLRIPLLDPACRPRDNRLDSLLLDVSAALAHSWTLDELCTRAHLSRAQLHRRFVSEYGRPPMALVNELRLQRAALLLETTSQPIAVVGESVGFANAFYFSAAFKVQFGVSPRAWRQGQRVMLTKPV